MIVMSDELKKLIKEHWVEIGTQAEKQLLKSLDPNVAKQYIEAMNRLEVDETYAKELGIIF